MDKELLFNVPEISVYLITTIRGEEKFSSALKKRPWIVPVLMGEVSNLPSALKNLKNLVIAELSAIGGRTLATSLIDQGLIQELYLTTSRKSGGEPDTPFYTGRKNFERKLVLRKEGRGKDQGIIFEHYLLSQALGPDNLTPLSG